MFENMKDKKLTRREDDKMVFGVAAGLADYVGIDVTVMRLILIILAMVTDGFALVLYLILAVVMPKLSVPTQKEPEVILS